MKLLELFKELFSNSTQEIALPLKQLTIEDLVNRYVLHKAYGRGRTTRLIESRLYVSFDEKEKIFVFPDAFKNHMKFEENELNEFVSKFIDDYDIPRKAESLSNVEGIVKEIEEKREARNQSESKPIEKVEETQIDNKREEYKWYVLGIDAAWTENAPSGVALISIDENETWEIVKIARSYDEFLEDEIDWTTKAYGSMPDLSRLISYCESNDWDVDLVALDIPLSSEKIVGRRKCDDIISRIYGGRNASTHSPSPERPGKISEEIYEQLTDIGYSWQGTLQEKSFIEVYPHVSIIEMFNYTERLKYKVDRAASYWPNESPERRKFLLKMNLNELRSEIMDLVPNLSEHMPKLSLSENSTINLKGYEDTLDAVVCALTGCYHLNGETIRHGDEVAEIWVPRIEQDLEYIPEQVAYKQESTVKSYVPYEQSMRSGNIMKTTFKSTEKGYENKNGQLNLGRSNEMSNHYNQTKFSMRCGRCGFEYTANGCDIWLRKCPKCQGGAR